jgi:hypothetical protein
MTFYFENILNSAKYTKSFKTFPHLDLCFKNKAECAVFPWSAVKYIDNTATTVHIYALNSLNIMK